MLDACGWPAYFPDEPHADKFAPYVEVEGRVLAPPRPSTNFRPGQAVTSTTPRGSSAAHTKASQAACAGAPRAQGEPK